MLHKPMQQHVYSWCMVTHFLQRPLWWALSPYPGCMRKHTICVNTIETQCTFLTLLHLRMHIRCWMELILWGNDAAEHGTLRKLQWHTKWKQMFPCHCILLFPSSSQLVDPDPDPDFTQVFQFSPWVPALSSPGRATYGIDDLMTCTLHTVPTE